MAIVLFSVLLSLAMDPSSGSGWSGLFSEFCMVFAGGILVGLVTGIIAHFILVMARNAYACNMVTLVCAYGSFVIAEDLNHVSGVMAVLAAGLTLRYFEMKHEDGSRGSADSRYFWGLASHLAEIMIFLLAGITITLGMFTDQWLAITFGIIAVLLARFILVFPALGLVSLFPGSEKLPAREQFIVGWGGVRGTVTLALALSLPLSLDYFYTIQSVAYGVVLFTLFVQATTIRLLVRD